MGFTSHHWYVKVFQQLRGWKQLLKVVSVFRQMNYNVRFLSFWLDQETGQSYVFLSAQSACTAGS
jgi:hypothetical protein